MALTIVAAINALTTIGLDRTIVANKFDTKDELKANLNTVWSAELIRSFVIALMVSVSSFPISRFYGQPQLKLIVPVLGLVTLVQGFQNIGLVILRKEISFAKIFWYELATNLSGITLTVALALVMRNVWVLVTGLLLTAILRTILSYIFHSYCPRLAFEKFALRRASSLGKFTLVIAVASFATNMADNVMVGRLLGTAALGNSNFFRYKLLLERGGWWSDTDTICLKPFDFPAEYVFSSEMNHKGREVVNSGVIKVPPGSEVMAYAWKVCQRKNPARLAWGETGPRLMAKAVKKCGLGHYKTSHEAFCPIDYEEWCKVLQPGFELLLTERIYAIHLWNEM